MGAPCVSRRSTPDPKTSESPGCKARGSLVRSSHDDERERPHQRHCL
ncbi:hypothetical protein FF47_34A [Mycobacterium phage FF47]|uniref:Uncharacterized protein n=1 Tax=Mycobacterium phage FF47 TaxID=1305710 RepID=M4W8G5_9CAUD|nr:hypothetical protein FF47_34A [Mycobacterium phage FF47]AGI12303.1 hypothetical protein FF47_34A [Mycobacterium phage FF47]